MSLNLEIVICFGYWLKCLCLTIIEINAKLTTKCLMVVLNVIAKIPSFTTIRELLELENFHY